jgi:hypothetical protein
MLFEKMQEQITRLLESDIRYLDSCLQNLVDRIASSQSSGLVSQLGLERLAKLTAKRQQEVLLPQVQDLIKSHFATLAHEATAGIRNAYDRIESAVGREQAEWWKSRPIAAADGDEEHWVSVIRTAGELHDQLLHEVCNSQFATDT